MILSERLNKLERLELALIVLTAIVLVVATEILSALRFSFSASLGHIILWFSALLLFQGLLRDLWILRTRSKTGPTEEKTAKMMCMESSIGLLGILVGLGLSFYFSSLAVALANWIWICLIAITLIIGFLLKDFVIAFDPLRITREPDHLNVVVKFW